jgi:hypothetical protein
MITGAPLLRRGEEGGLVERVQQSLIEAGYNIDPTEAHDTSFGESTYDAVRAFQAGRVGPDGHALTEDGIVGPATLWALEHGGEAIRGRYTAPGWRVFPNDARAAVRPAVLSAVGEIGHFEQPDGSNAGPRIDKFGQKGQPWCAFFVSWAFGQLPEASPFGVIGSVYGLYGWAKTHGRVLGAPAVPQPGDVFVILRANQHGHCGIVGACPDTMTAIHTIEGNASNAVRGMIRQRNTISAFLRPIPL